MYKVIDRETGNTIFVDAINVSQHLHCTGIEFTENMLTGLEVTTDDVPKSRKAKS